MEVGGGGIRAWPGVSRGRGGDSKLGICDKISKWSRSISDYNSADIMDLGP